MKNKNTTHILKFAFSIGLIILMQACTIQKRTYNKGYFVQWNLDKNNSQKSNPKEHLVEESKVNYDLTEEISSTENQESEIQNEVVLNAKSDKLVESTSENFEPTISTTFTQNKSENLSTGKKMNIKKINSIKRQFKMTPSADGELIVNIILTLVFLGLTILFIVLILSAIVPLLYIYALAGLVSLILLVTQVIDLINY